MSFADLQLVSPLVRALAECGYTEPTPIQLQTIPEALAGRDLLASAQTGTGKTAAFVLPALQRLATPRPTPKGAPRVLVLTPTRELAAQVADSVRKYGRFLRPKSAVLFGGMPYGPQFRELSRPLDLVVATPGRLIDHLDRRSLDLSHLEILILDEADRMLDMGFKEDVERICAASPAARQTLLFTATLDRTMAELATRLLRTPVRVQVAAEQVTHENIEQRLHVADSRDHKRQILHHLVSDRSLNRAIVFSGTRQGADILARELNAQGHRAAALHGDMTQGARNKTVEELRRGRIRLLIATDVAARGLDVSGISHVINFDLPMNAEDYVHRIGRTGRAGASGIAISFASRDDAVRLKRIEHYIGRALPREVIPGLEPTILLQVPRTARPGTGSGKPAGRLRNGGNRTGAPPRSGAPRTDRYAAPGAKSAKRPSPQGRRSD